MRLSLRESFGPVVPRAAKLLQGAAVKVLLKIVEGPIHRRPDVALGVKVGLRRENGGIFDVSAAPAAQKNEALYRAEQEAFRGLFHSFPPPGTGSGVDKTTGNRYTKVRKGAAGRRLPLLGSSINRRLWDRAVTSFCIPE